MKVSEKRKLYLKQIDIHFSELDKGLEALLYSYKKCQAIKDNKSEYNPEELEAFEAFSARFARASDILTQKADQISLKASTGGYSNHYRYSQFS